MVILRPAVVSPLTKMSVPPVRHKVASVTSLEKIRNQKLKHTVTAMRDEQFEVRDLREPGWHWVDNEFTDNYSRPLGHCPTLVYDLLCRHSDTYQISWPTVPEMASRLQFSERQITRAIFILEEYNLIRVKRTQGAPNAYQLVNKRNWKKLKVTLMYSAVSKGTSEKHIKAKRLIGPSVQLKKNRVKCDPHD